MTQLQYVENVEFVNKVISECMGYKCKSSLFIWRSGIPASNTPSVPFPKYNTHRRTAKTLTSQ